MYKVTSKLKIVAFALMILGAVLTAVGFWQMPGSEEEVKEMLATEAAAHGGGHGAMEDNHSSAADNHAVSGHATSSDHHSEGHATNHEDEHAEHVYHQLSNKPWAAVYVAAFFFFMIGLGTLAFHAVQKAAQAG